MPENRLPTAARAAVAGLAMGLAAVLPGVGPASGAPAPPHRPDRPTAAAHLGLHLSCGQPGSCEIEPVFPRGEA